MVLIASGHAANFDLGTWRCLECEAHELTDIRTDGQTFWVGAMGRAIKREVRRMVEAAYTPQNQLSTWPVAADE